MIDTLRNGMRMAGGALMNSEMVYSFLMGMGWFFLLGWAVALVVACASVFRHDGAVQYAGILTECAPESLHEKLVVRKRCGEEGFRKTASHGTDSLS